MGSPIIEIDFTDWNQARNSPPEWTAAIESGQVLYFPRLAFDLRPEEKPLLRENVLKAGARNVSLGSDGVLKHAAGTSEEQKLLTGMIVRYRQQVLALVDGLFPHYRGTLRVAPTSFRPKQVETRSQSVHADDRRLHFDAFATRPTYGERILRVFTNLNPNGQPRVWRVGESFETVAKRYLPRIPPYSPVKAKLLNAVRATKSVRSEYDHLMFYLHNLMKEDEQYQKTGAVATQPFPPGCVWVCYADGAAHGVMSGQYMMEQTLHLPPGGEADPQSSPLAILTRLVGHPLAGVGMDKTH
ncbi:Kdo hydroxylase family protein [Azonexus sp.]|uniref:Kdo hydroxylase family protein n=1 Tax=Azonexus sp. TaxID=1872668 RepID=UPI0028192A79|nr:Kdo hydroxylase family protein [Azonexus sp.]MDR1995881.1 Kdo hydroxylase family protein [Azonexus sp.]